MPGLLEHPIRVLGIAPYEGMRAQMQQVAQQYDDVLLTALVGDRNEGLEIVRRESNGNYDAIISRGGTAEIIRESVDIPTIAIEFSAYDILRALKLATSYQGRYAVVGFAAVTKGARLLCDLLQYPLDIYTVQRDGEVLPLLQTLQTQGYGMFISDTITNQLAQRSGMNSILIASGLESVEDAFQNAIQACRSYLSIKRQLRLMQAFAVNSPVGLALYGPDGAPLMGHPSPAPDAEELYHQLLQENSDEGLYERKTDGTLLTARMKRFVFHGETYAGCACEAAPLPPAARGDSVRYFTREEALERFLHEFYGLPSQALEACEVYDHSNIAYPPLLIIGEEGAGTDQAAASAYAQSRYRSRPFICVDFSLLSDKEWAALREQVYSPFTQERVTLHLQRLDTASDQRLTELLSYALDTKLCGRNRVILSARGDGARLIELENQLACQTVRLVPLRERAAEIPTIASLYLASYNLRFAKQVIGFQPDALEMLLRYPWPQNLLEFRRVMQEMVSTTDGPYMAAKTVRQALRPDDSSAPTGGEGLDLNRSLAEIDAEIVRRVLERCGGHQSKAAQQLQISRSTLWRMLKR